MVPPYQTKNGNDRGMVHCLTHIKSWLLMVVHDSSWWLMMIHEKWWLMALFYYHQITSYHHW
jgi:hypothetical protein